MTLGRGYLAAALATAMAVTPSLAQDPGNLAAKPATTGASIAVNGNTLPAPKWVREPIGPKNDKFLRVADMRGMGAASAAILALGASDRNAVILLVQGDDKNVIADARRVLRTLVSVYDYDRVGLVIGDGPSDTAYIYSKGHKVMTLTDVVEAEDRDSGFDNNMHRIYERDVLPALTTASAPRPPGQ